MSSVRLRKIFATGAFTLDQIRNRVHAQAIHAQVQPVAHHLEHLVHHPRVVIVQVRLVRKEAVPDSTPARRDPRSNWIFPCQ